ncbi:MAG: RidA family protein [Planctomycetaceae bacterium]
MCRQQPADVEAGTRHAAAGWRILRLTGYVYSAPHFTDQHLVIDGASQLLLDVFGEEAGLPARTALGVAALPLRASVETEMIVKLKPE